MASDRIRFLLDEHIPAPVAQGLARRGIDAVTVQQVGRQSDSDANQLVFARAEGRVIVTFDDDYLALAAGDVEHAGIAFTPASCRAVGELIHALLLLHDVLTPRDMHNHVEFL